MRDSDLFFGASGYLLLVLAVYYSIKNYKGLCRFIRDFIKGEWYRSPENRKPENRPKGWKKKKKR